jgi:hypothetical protein
LYNLDLLAGHTEQNKPLVMVRLEARQGAHLRLGGGGRSREKRDKASIYPG